MPKKRKKKGGKAGRIDYSSTNHAVREDELLALQAIFDEDLVADEDGEGFKLRLVPHPGALEANFVSVTVHVRYPAAYPLQPVALRVRPASSTPAELAKRIAQLLNARAMTLARSQEPCVFSLIDLCQEMLREHNLPSLSNIDDLVEEEGDGGKRRALGQTGQSLWHAMQQRQVPAPATALDSSDGSVSGLLGMDALLPTADLWSSSGQDLFAEEVDEALFSVPPVAVMQRSSTPTAPHAPAEQAAQVVRAGPQQRACQEPHRRTAPAARAAVGATQPIPPNQAGRPPANMTSAAAAAAIGGSGSSGSAAAASSIEDGSEVGTGGEEDEEVQGGSAVAMAQCLDGGFSSSKTVQASQAVALQPTRSMLQVVQGSKSSTTSSVFSNATSSAVAASTVRDSGTFPREVILATTQPPAVQVRVRPPSGRMGPTPRTARPGSGVHPSRWLRRSATSSTSSSSSSPRPSQWSLTASQRSASGGGGGGTGGSSGSLEHRRVYLLLGHVMQLLAAGDDSSGSTLPQLLTHLRQHGLLPSWVYWLLTKQPELFDIAFKKHFSEEMNETGSAAAISPASAPPLRRFWDRSTVAPCVSSTTAGAPSDSAATAVAAAAAAPSGSSLPTNSMSAPPPGLPVSRYRSDFQELYRLGKGGFGIVVAAINRLDGRQYAIKKIKLDSRTPTSHSRIMREVATLSRLSHPNVVRYFQAWCEPIEPLFTAGSDLISEDDWDATDGTDEPLRSRSLPGGNARGVGDPGAAGKAGSLPLASPSFPPRLPHEMSLPAVREEFYGMALEEEDDLFFARSGVQAESEASLEAVCQRPAAATAHKASELLLIQMEFCPRTLHQVLQTGPMEEEDAKHVLRGILAGLAHLHSQGIIHRDIKPDNIFYDAKGDIKLGDFGLAKSIPGTPTAQGPGPAAHKRGDAPLTVHVGGPAQGGGSAVDGVFGSSDQQLEKTGLVGTSYYIAPEIADCWASYDEKVDLYSVGVVVFELWHPLATGMERHLLLQALREGGRLPQRFEQEHPKIAQLIRWLMAGNPAERPSAREVLASELLPPRMEDEQLQDLLRSLPTRRDTYERVVDHIFSMSMGSSTEVPTSLTSQADEAVSVSQRAAPHDISGGAHHMTVGAHERVMHTVKHVFDCHGAVAMSSNQVSFAHSSLPPDAVRLLSPNGSLLALRYEMRYPFAAWLAQQSAAAAAALSLGVSSTGFRGGGGFAAGGTAALSNLECMRRYEIGTVQRRSRFGGGLPNTYCQADMDLVASPAISSSAPADRLLLEAEAIKTVTQVLEALPEVGQFEVRLGSRQLLELMVYSLSLPRDVAGSVLQLLGTVSSASPGGTVPLGDCAARSKLWPGIRAGLDGLGLGGVSIARCRQAVLQLPGESMAAIERLRVYFQEVLRSASLAAPGRPRDAGGGVNAAHLAAAAAALDELATLSQYLTTWGIPHQQVIVDPLVAPHSEYYSGVLFQVHLVAPSGPLGGAGGATALVGVGGRYDGLLRSLWPAIASGPAPGAVGLTINMERMFRLLDNSYGLGGAPAGAAAAGATHNDMSLSLGSRTTTSSGGTVAGQRGIVAASCSDVLVCCSRGSDASLSTRMRLLSQLWAAGIRAELLPAVLPGLSEQFAFAQARGIRWLVILEEGRQQSSAQTVKVKRLDRKVEDIVLLTDVVRFVQLALGGVLDPARMLSSGRGGAASSATGGNAAGAHRVAGATSHPNTSAGNNTGASAGGGAGASARDMGRDRAWRERVASTQDEAGSTVGGRGGEPEAEPERRTHGRRDRALARR